MNAEHEILAQMCHFYLRRELDRTQFRDAVFDLIAPYDVFTKSMMLTRVEATVREHFCAWWSDCIRECQYRADATLLPPWCDGWVAFEWNEGTTAVRAQPDTKSRPSMRCARSVVTPALRNRIFARDGHRCVACGGPPPLELDHIVPVSRGGSSDEANLQSLCVACNRSKGATVPTQVSA